MAIEIKELSASKKDLKQFIKFPFKLYKDNPYYVPPLLAFELSTFLKEKNPAFESAEAKYWVALKNREIVGRVAGIILNEELENKSLARFGWIDFVDDMEVSKLLLATVSSWAKSKGAKSLHGPMGFTDMDFEGALTQGYEEVATQATIYNFPYYIDHYEKLGFETSAEWLETRVKVPEILPEKVKRVERIIKEKYKLRSVEFKNKKEVLKYAHQVFDLINDTYSDLYGYHALSEKQIQYYIDQYFGFVKKDFLCFIVDENDRIVGFSVSFPSFSNAFQKAKGSLFPFGFIHLLNAVRKNTIADAFLIAVRKEYQKMGLHTIMFSKMFEVYTKNGIKYMHSGPALLDNSSAINIWKGYEKTSANIRRKCYIKKID